MRHDPERDGGHVLTDDLSDVDRMTDEDIYASDGPPPRDVLRAPAPRHAPPRSGPPTAMADEKEAMQGAPGRVPLESRTGVRVEAAKAPSGRSWMRDPRIRDPLRDIAYLRELTYQGRHFRDVSRTSGGERVNDVTGVRRNAGPSTKPEVRALREFTYTVPRSYPRERELNRVPRVVSVSVSPMPSTSRGQTETIPEPRVSNGATLEAPRPGSTTTGSPWHRSRRARSSWTRTGPSDTDS